MLKIIAILVLSTNLTVAVETEAGWKEQVFPNSAQGAEQLIDFAERTIGNPPDGVRVVVGSLSDDDDATHILGTLAEAGIMNGVVLPEDVRASAARHSVKETSAIAVAFAEVDRFEFLYRRKGAK